MKLRLLAALVAVTLSTGAFAQTNSAPAAGQSAAPTVAGPNMAGIDKNTLSYGLGYDMGSGYASRNVQVDIATVIRGLQDGYAKRQPTVPADKLDATLRQFEQAMVTQARTEFEKAARENKAKSDVFLASNRTKTGVVTLPGGLQYRIIEVGSGAKPTGTSTVVIHYRESISTGQEVQSTYSGAAQPASVKMAELNLAGLKQALMMMPVGSRWEVFLPPDLAYGNEPRSPVGPGQALIFDIKLISAQ